MMMMMIRRESIPTTTTTTDRILNKTDLQTSKRPKNWKFRE